MFTDNSHLCGKSIPSTRPVDDQKQNEMKTWLKRVGVVGFLFFLVKGLIWLGIFFFAGSSMFKGCA
jgi:hypothetical protein